MEEKAVLTATKRHKKARKQRIGKNLKAADYRRFLSDRKQVTTIAPFTRETNGFGALFRYVFHSICGNSVNLRLNLLPDLG